jgi:hypothetical protein
MAPNFLEEHEPAPAQSGGKAQTLRLVFTMHEVLIRGHSLRRIETAMQRMELSALNTLPANQRSLVPDGQPVVHEITVTETNSLDKE